MTREDKKKIERRAYWHDLLRQLRGTPDFPVKLFFLALFLVGAVYVATKQAILREQVKHIELISPILKAAMEHAVTAYLFVGGLALLTLLLYPFGRRAAKDQLQCIGLINHAGMPPDLLRKRRDKDNPRVTIWEFRNQSIPLQEWEKKCLAIETALGITIVKLAYAKGRSRVLVYSVSADDDLPEVLKWRDSYLSPKSFVLVLGESYAGPVTVNLAHIPHILLGGSTGSGKSVLLVEADMRRRSLADMLGVRSRGGLYAVLSEQVSIDQAIVETGQKNFYFLDAEPHIPNPADIIVSHRFAKLVKALSAKFQYVIFDSPPVGTFIDAAEIASLTDGALFVVREDFTKREEALNAIGQLKKSEKVKLIGTVMNYCETETSEYYYSYYTKDGKKVKKGSDDQGTSKKGIFTNRANV